MRQTQVPVASLTMIGIADVDAQFFEFTRIEQPVAIVADAADECRRAAELRKRNHRVGDRAAADQSRLMLLIPLQQCLLLGEVHELHAAAVKAKRGKFLVGYFEEDIDDCVPQST